MTIPFLSSPVEIIWLPLSFGLMTQVFLYPALMRLREQARAEGIVRERRAYIIRNARLDPDWSQVDRRTLSIAGRAISALIATQGLGDLYRLYLDCQRDGVDYNVACIPSDFDVPAREAFDPAYMKALFERGQALVRNGSPWRKFPPGFDAQIGSHSANEEARLDFEAGLELRDQDGSER